MHFHDGYGERSQRIAKPKPVVGEGSGIEQKTIYVGSPLFDGVDEGAFRVGLKCGDVPAPSARNLGEPAVDLRKSGDAVDLGLAPTEGPEVGSVQDENRRHGGAHTPKGGGPRRQSIRAASRFMLARNEVEGVLEDPLRHI